jgi:transposase InsO family protein
MGGVQCHYIRLDIDVRAIGKNETSLGRPWLTLVVDHYSRRILSLHFSFNPPSRDSFVKAQ